MPKNDNRKNVIFFKTFAEGRKNPKKLYLRIYKNIYILKCSCCWI